MLAAGTPSRRRMRRSSATALIIPGTLIVMLVATGPTVAASDEAVPPDYAGRVMPAGWAGDPKVIAAGKEIYEGKAKLDVNCAKCHGSDGKPTRLGKGAPDLSDPAEDSKHSDAHWFWRISEKKLGSKMPGYKDKVSEEQRWQVIAYLRSLAQSGR